VTGWPVATFQIRAVWSQEAVTTRVPSGLKAAAKTPSVCPVRVATGWPVAAFQIRAVWSQDAVTTRVPSGLKAAAKIAPVCPVRVVTDWPRSASQIALSGPRTPSPRGCRPG
jgi:hypothetical protein